MRQQMLHYNGPIGCSGEFINGFFVTGWSPEDEEIWNMIIALK